MFFVCYAEISEKTTANLNCMFFVFCISFCCSFWIRRKVCGREFILLHIQYVTLFIEEDREGVVPGDNDPPQDMGDDSKEVTDEAANEVSSSHYYLYLVV